MQQDMTNSFLKGIFNFREGERLPKFILPWKMKLNGEGLPSALAGGMSCHFEWLMKYSNFPGSERSL